MKLAIEFVDSKTKEKITNLWKEKGLNVDFGSMGSTWVYDLEKCNSDNIFLELIFKKNNKLIIENVRHKDILYFEVHKN